MRRAKRHGVRFMLTGADAPAPLKQGNRLAPGREAAYAAYLARLLGVAKHNGTPFSYAAVANEPDNPGNPVEMAPEQAARVYAKLARRVKDQRLGTRLVLGDNTGWPQTLAYAPVELAAPGVRRASAAVASHSYSGDEADMSSLAAFARRSRLPVWQTEWTTGCATCRDEDSMGLALRWALQINVGLTVAEAAAWFSFRAVADASHGAQGGLLVRRRDDPQRPFYATKRFEVFRHYTSAGQPGSRRLAVDVREHGVAAVAFRRRGTVAVVLTNPGPRRVEIGLDLGKRSGRLTGRRTSARQNFAALAPLDYAGRAVRVRLPAESVTSFALSRASR
jgi:O-glycosyl hydrolase